MSDSLECYLFVQGAVQEPDVVTVNDFGGHAQVWEETRNLVDCGNARSIDKVLRFRINALRCRGQDHQRLCRLYPGIEQVVETEGNGEKPSIGECTLPNLLTYFLREPTKKCTMGSWEMRLTNSLEGLIT